MDETTGAIADDWITEATIDLAALRANAIEAQRLAGEREVFAVVKADAYGHCAVPVCRALLEVGIDRLVVLNVEEAAELREAGIDAPILVLGGARNDAEASAAIDLHLCPVLHHRESFERTRAAARSAGRTLAVHVEIDTGMSRMGVPCAQAESFLKQVDEEPSLVLDGAFTHFSASEDRDLAIALDQQRRFRAIVLAARAQGIALPSVHIANSGALVAGPALADAFPEATAVRPGLMLYGVQPAPHIRAELRPVMCLRARVVRVQEVPAGAGVGYGSTYRVPGRGSASPDCAGSRIVTVPIGYADGVSCLAGNRGEVWIAGCRHPIVGRVSMDSISVDVGDARVEIGDEVVIFGNADATGGDAAAIAVEEAAGWAQTIPYELLVRVGNRVPRRIVG